MHTISKEKELDMRSLLRHFWQHKQWIVITTSLVFCLGVGYALLKKPLYQTESIFQVVEENKISDFNHLLPYASSLSENPTTLQIALLKSRLVLEPVIKALHLNTAKSHPIKKAIQQLQKKLSIKELGNHTGLVELSFRGENPLLAMQIMQHLTAQLVRLDKEKKSYEINNTLLFLQKELALAKSALKEAEQKLYRYQSNSGKIDSSLQAKHAILQLVAVEKELQTLAVTKETLKSQYTAKHPRMITFLTKHRALLAEKARLQKHLRSLPLSEEIAHSLVRNAEAKAKMYMELLHKIQEIRILSASNPSNVHILSGATMPDAPLPSKTALILITSLLFGISASILSLLGYYWLFPKIIDPLWGEEELQLTTLATIRPYSGKTQPNCIVRDYPHHSTVEALRSLCARIKMNTMPHPLIAIMGISPGVGKSFITANLAYLFAQSGKRVLLIDADLRRGTLHSYFQKEPAKGLSEVISNQLPWDKALHNLHENLYLLTRGTYLAHPSELLSSQAFSTTLTTLKNEFDIVLLDTPPLSLVTDSLAIGTITTQNYLVLGAYVDHPQTVANFVKQLKNTGISLHGSIFNCINKKKAFPPRFYAKEDYRRSKAT